MESHESTDRPRTKVLFIFAFLSLWFWTLGPLDLDGNYLPNSFIAEKIDGVVFHLIPIPSIKHGVEIT